MVGKRRAEMRDIERPKELVPRVHPITRVVFHGEAINDLDVLQDDCRWNTLQKIELTLALSLIAIVEKRIVCRIGPVLKTSRFLPFED